MALANKHGEVMASVPGLADMARITIQECEVGLLAFLSPDKYSRTKTFEGRRIAEIDGGWSLLNHAKYRLLCSKEEAVASASARTARHRASKTVDSNGLSTVCNGLSTVDRYIADADADSRKAEAPTGKTPLPPQAGESLPLTEATEAPEAVVKPNKLSPKETPISVAPPPPTPVGPWHLAHGVDLPEPLRGQGCIEAAHLWLRHKKEKKSPYKPTGLLVMTGVWVKAFTAETFPRAVEHSIASNYSGVFHDPADKPMQRGPAPVARADDPFMGKARVTLKELIEKYGDGEKMMIARARLMNEGRH